MKKKKRKKNVLELKKEKIKNSTYRDSKRKKTEIPTSINAIYAGHGEVPNYTRTGQK